MKPGRFIAAMVILAAASSGRASDFFKLGRKEKPALSAEAISKRDLDRALLAALKQFRKANLPGVEAELRRAAVVLELEAGAAPKAAKPDLSAAAAALRRLADQMDGTNPNLAGRLDRTVSSAYWAEAKNRRLCAQRFWAEQQPEHVSPELKWTADDLEKSLGFSGEQVTAATRYTIKKARQVSADLGKRAACPPEAVNESLERLRGEIEDLAEVVAPPKQNSKSGPHPRAPAKARSASASNK